MKDELVQAIADIQEEDALKITEKMLEAGEDPQDVLDACREAMVIVGDRYEQGEYFLPELILAGDILHDLGELVKPKMAGGAATEEALGKVVLGTVAGDIHDIGKDIVAFMLDVNNFEVHDLGVDVSAEAFIEKIKEVEPEVVALSGFLTLAFDSMKNTVQSIKDAGLRDEVKIMIGGAPMDEGVREYIGADTYGPDAGAAVRIAKKWVNEGAK